ncbi:MAG TPA: LamG domain-containing protein [Acidimicrobiia bacterium]|nr:LamG domain-containing protein [Acidimicrobiia bacterium]
MDGVSDASHVLPDANGDASNDGNSGGRVTSGLVALWTFDDGGGSVANETSGVLPAVPLSISKGAVTWGAGTMTVAGPTLLLSDVGSATRLSQAVLGGHGVTLEAWVDPAASSEGSPTTPATVAGIDSSVSSRDISIFQVGDQWMGRVRTNMTDPAWQNGGPDLLPAPNVVVAGVMTHIVLVADDTNRALYVDGQQIASTPPEAPFKWDGSYKMVLANDNNTLMRAWTGTYALVAVYDRALGSAEIEANFIAGP